MKRGLLIAALASVVMFFVPERRCEGSDCIPRPLAAYAGELVKLERVDGQPIVDPQVDGLPRSVCLGRPQLDAPEVRLGDCSGEAYAAFFRAAP